MNEYQKMLQVLEKDYRFACGKAMIEQQIKELRYVE